ncbi:hypothetical protein AYL99_06220 [Fonsecaea erecta]|uniref:Uncharacterized protein n=1 Tax=Fonsecaea erecta TaxID=1367422 RepID=A0A178ZI96_9EURO|nr:hypothetical protein AYL99_06220 [Fonsecaea erecta]OAP58923.1 hypothetical protein AYL99_06220 [Fonsecaea erecta]
MKKLARTLSSRGSGSKAYPRPSSSSGNGNTRPDQAHVRKSSLTSPIPPYTQLHFPGCSHTTPPTPRPARLPTVLRTEVIETARTPEEAARSDDTDRNIQVRQFLTSPGKCLDCTLVQAAQQESWIRERCDAVVREVRLRLVELKSGLAAARAAGDGAESVEMELEAEISGHEARVAELLRQRDGDLKRLWDDVRRDWEGGVREIVRDDGTGEAEERCVFVVPWEEDNCVTEKDADGTRQGESRATVRVLWLPLEGE